MKRPEYLWICRYMGVRIEWEPAPHVGEIAPVRLELNPATLDMDGWSFAATLIDRMRLANLVTGRVDVAVDFPFVNVDDVRVWRPRQKLRNQENGQTIGTNNSTVMFASYDRKLKPKNPTEDTIWRIEARPKRTKLALRDLPSLGDPFERLAVATSIGAECVGDEDAEMTGLLGLLHMGSLADVCANTRRHSVRKAFLDLLARRTADVLEHPSAVFGRCYPAVAAEVVAALVDGVLPSWVCEDARE